jgi:hypothetical protein
MPATHDERAIADAELLTGSGSGSAFKRGYLRDQPLIEELDADERVIYLLSNKRKGVRRDVDGEETAYKPGDGYQAIAAVTDTRVLFVVGDGGEDGDELVAVPYTDVENVKTTGGMLTKSLDVWTTQGVRWRFFVRRTVDVEPAADYVDKGAIVWSRVMGQLRHARRYIAAIAEHLETGELAKARSAVADARDHIEEAQRKTPEHTTDRSDGLWQRIDGVERELDSAILDIHVAKADAAETAARAEWDEGAYEAAYDQFLAARNQYERALDVCRANDFEAGSDVRAQADAVTQTLDRLSKAPLRSAEAARDAAAAAEDPAAAAEAYETALDRYRTALVLDWGADAPRFAGESEELRGKIETITDAIADARREAAADCRREGRRHLENGATEAARTAFDQARSHLAAALALLEELNPDRAATVEAELDAVPTDTAAALDATTASQPVDDDSGA